MENKKPCIGCGVIMIKKSGGGHQWKTKKYCTSRCFYDHFKSKQKQRFLASYKEAPNGCWEWQKSFSGKGYGVSRINGKNEGAHRVSYIIHFGEIPYGMWVLHKCDNPKCVNPKHLFLGDSLTNVRDMIKKGRANYKRVKGCRTGEKTPSAKLTWKDVDYIRKSDETLEVLSRKFGVSSGHIWRIRKNLAWDERYR